MGTIVGVDRGPHRSGGGDPILLIHGMNMSHDVWSDVASLLAARYRVVSFDLRGHGQSVKAGPYGARDYASDAFAVLDSLGIVRAHLVGVSFGASVACAMASGQPSRTASIAAFGGALRAGHVEADQVLELLRSMGAEAFFRAALKDHSFHPDASGALLERAVDAATGGRDVETVVQVMKSALSADVSAEAKATSAPALVVTGEQDRTTPTMEGRALAAALGTELVVVPCCGHMAPLEAPEAVAALIEGHVAQSSLRAGC